MKTVFITGAGRGIGLEFVRQYAQEGWLVIATARKISAELQNSANEFPNVTTHTLDVSSSDSIQAITSELKNQPIDLLINNAAIFRDSTLGNISYDEFRQTLDTNTLGPLQIAEALIENISAAEGKTIINMTGHLGSFDFISKNRDYFPGYYSYKVSKAALNMVTLLLAHDLKSMGITVIGLSPGWVETQMGGSNAPLSPATAVEKVRAFIQDLTPDQTGRFFEHGKELPW